jgi:hypothetical protein
MEVRLRRRLVDGKNSIDNVRSKLLGKGVVEFRGKRGARNTKQKFSVDFFLQLECVQELKRKISTSHPVRERVVPSKPQS